MPIVTRSRRLLAVTALAASGVLVLAGCSSDAEEDDTSAGAESPAAEAPADEAGDDAGEWPRTFENADGTTTEIPEQPTNILSTTVSKTGTLLSIDAPVTVTATDANGDFFPQWADAAESAGVEKAWPAGAPDIEAAIAAQPDLIVVATTGQDAMVDAVADLQAIAPTIVIDYGAESWQDLAVELGEATGLEAQAQAAIDAYDDLVESTAASIVVPEGQANIVSYNGPGGSNPIGHADGPHGSILQALGFSIEEPNAEWHTQPEARADFVFADYEHLTELTADTTFILSQDDEGAREGFGADEVLANVPSVKNGQVYGLGANSFRIDMFSATEIVEHIAETFAG
jgi:iron complex transport system substrate-binding protein